MHELVSIFYEATKPGASIQSHPSVIAVFTTAEAIPAKCADIRQILGSARMVVAARPDQITVVCTAGFSFYG